MGMERIDMSGLTATGLHTALMRIAGVCPAIIDAEHAISVGDWDLFESACERMTDDELDMYCNRASLPNPTIRVETEGLPADILKQPAGRYQVRSLLPDGARFGC